MDNGARKWGKGFTALITPVSNHRQNKIKTTSNGMGPKQQK
jgi:hypothetical protein